LSPVPQSSGASTLRRTIAALILVPLAVVIIAFAVANRQNVTVSLDPFSSDVPAASVHGPLFLVLVAVLILGVILGGVAAWLRQAKWRRTARRLEREVADLRSELDMFKRAADSGSAGTVPASGEPPERLKLTPPMR
jgi:uncharacterized integral membrane protein